ncbi:DUF362 domain-containing protein [Pseudanabaena sp. FACHB-2040]|uniref:DUF362 domain-containing protein n=1 Tax=Pseudanabaena sp. FACHB-2040 TaxID=2692859 RepID=UPI0016846BC1|nr:DUF362 domain-containing protein [Pseudanabaena sp. FACHB-2040]MBD2258732.1 DUF362 domain-containing protein [Pseudanabaena sp. FACHB-2040]
MSAQSPKQPSRRKLLKRLGWFTGAIALPPTLRAFAVPSQPPANLNPAIPSMLPPELALPMPLAAAGLNPHRVVLVKATDRATGIRRAIELLQPPSFSGKRVFIKPNYNTGDPAPAATAPVVLETLVQEIQGAGASQISVGDRSGMAETRSAMQRMQVFSLAERYGFNSIVFDELGREDWQYFPAEGTNWSRGFAIARPVLAADAIVNACCLKTHRFGGHFTLSLKNTIGMVARRVPGDGHDYMRELHRSANQRLMIAEVNKVYRPALIVIDGVDAFVGGGPEQGQRVSPGVILASTDRIAIDAVGIAILRMLGTTREVSSGSIWSQAQIRRAADLGLGAASADRIELVTADSASAQMADQVRPFLS